MYRIYLILDFVVLTGMVFFNNCRLQPKEIIFPDGITLDSIPYNFIYDNNDAGIVVEVNINKENYTFALDNGAQFSLLDEKIKGKYLFKKDKILDSDLIIHTAKICSIDTLTLGNTKITNFNNYYQLNFNTIDGVIGGDIFQHLVLKIDFINNVLYITKEVKELDIDTTRYIPLEIRDNLAFINASFKGDALVFMLDLGYDGFATIDSTIYYSQNSAKILDNCWQYLYYNKTGNIFGTSDDIKTGDICYMLDTFKLSKLFLENELISIEKRRFSILGIDFFKRFQSVVFDYPNKKLYLGDKNLKSLNYLVSIARFVNSTGIFLGGSPPVIKRIRTDLVKPGLNLGDTVVEINNVNMLENPIIDKKSLKATIISKDTVRFQLSESLKALNNFNYIMDTSIIKTIKNDTIYTHQVIRNSNFYDLPNSVFMKQGAEDPFFLSKYNIKLNNKIKVIDSLGFYYLIGEFE